MSAAEVITPSPVFGCEVCPRMFSSPEAALDCAEQDWQWADDVRAGIEDPHGYDRPDEVEGLR